MTAAEEGVLLLCCALGDPEARPLTMAQFRELGLRVRGSNQPGDSLRALCTQDLTALGYDEDQAARILRLLDREVRLRRYLRAGEARGIFPVTRLSDAYPSRVAACRKLSSPPVLFCRGDVALLNAPSVALVGSRKLRPANACFAAQAGRLAAEEGIVLVSGGAPGADSEAQRACETAGGRAVIFTAERLTDRPERAGTLYCSEDGYDLPFSAVRALRRNALIHMQGGKTLVAQCTYGSGGTWNGSLDNLRHGWSPLYVYDDGSRGAEALIERGATAVHTLEQLADLQPSQQSLFGPA